MSISPPAAIGAAAPQQTAAGSRRSSLGWVPAQHGAWAILLVPPLVGTRLASNLGTLGWSTAALVGTWLVGYFGYHAAIGWLKARPLRRRRWLPALLTYSSGTALAGLVTIGLAGWPMLGWLIGFLPLAAVGLIAAARHQERSLISGLSTVAAACLMLPATAAPNPAALAGSPRLLLAITLAALVFGYFGGTVVHVKSLIRRRGQRRWGIAALAWQVFWGAAAAFLAGFVGWGFATLFALAWLRSFVLQRLSLERQVPIAVIGGIEIALSLILLISCWLTI